MAPAQQMQTVDCMYATNSVMYRDFFFYSHTPPLPPSLPPSLPQSSFISPSFSPPSHSLFPASPSLSWSGLCWTMKRYGHEKQLKT